MPPIRREPYPNYVQYGFTELRESSRESEPNRSFTYSEIYQAATRQMRATGQSKGPQAGFRIEDGIAQWELNGFIVRRDSEGSDDDDEPSYAFTPRGIEVTDRLLEIRAENAGIRNKRRRMVAVSTNALRRKHFNKDFGFQKYTVASVNSRLQHERRKNAVQANTRLARSGSFTDGLRSRANSISNMSDSTIDNAAQTPQSPVTPVRRRLTAQGSIVSQGRLPTPGPEPQEDTAPSAMDVDVQEIPEVDINTSATPVGPQRSLNDPTMAYLSPISIQRPLTGNANADPQAGTSSFAQVPQETPTKAGLGQNTSPTSFLGSVWRRLSGRGPATPNSLDADEANRKVDELEASLKEAQDRLGAVISTRDGDISALQLQKAELQEQLNVVKRELDDVKRELSDTQTELDGVRNEKDEAISKLADLDRTMRAIACVMGANPNTRQMVTEAQWQ